MRKGKEQRKGFGLAWFIANEEQKKKTINKAFSHVIQIRAAHNG